MRHQASAFRFFQLISFLAVLSFSSCIKTFNDRYPYFYEVQNTSDGVIKVVYKGLSGSWSGSPRNTFDSVIYITPGQKKTLFSRIMGQYYGPSPMRNPETDSLLSCITYLKITQIDTLASNRNYLETKYWNYYLISENKAGLLLTVLNTDFQ